MTFWKYEELFRQYRISHNAKIKKMLYVLDEENGAEAEKNMACYF